MPSNYRVPQSRGANMIDADPQRMQSDDGLRSALGRNVKGETAQPGCYQAVQVWTLKERRVEGRSFCEPSAPWRVADTHCSLEEAEEWAGQTWNPALHSTRKPRRPELGGQGKR
jgi:hypothetical protein